MHHFSFHLRIMSLLIRVNHLLLIIFYFNNITDVDNYFNCPRLVGGGGIFGSTYNSESAFSIELLNF